MKTKGKKLLTIMLVTYVLAGLTANSFAELSGEQKSLRGIKVMALKVGCAQQAEEAGLKEEAIRKEIATRLQQAGIKIIPEYMSGPPRLYISIKAYKIPRQEMFVDNIRVLLKQKVTLVRNPEEKITAVTWEFSWLSNASPQQFVKHIQRHIKILIDAFIRDYRAANLPAKQPADANDIGTISTTTTTQQPKPPAKPAVAEYKFVASKNSEVFHRPDCRWVKRIKPENLVGYNSKEEVMKAGKRPCKMCNP